MDRKLATKSGIAAAVACVASIGASNLPGETQDRQTRGKVREEFLDVALFLRRQGMADPNQGTYREAVVAYPNIYLGTMVEETVRGWVSDQDEDGAMELLAWNGLTYDVVEVGAMADLREDAKSGRLTVDRRTPVVESAELAGLFRINGPVPAAILALLGERELATYAIGRFLRRPRSNGSFSFNAVQHYDTILKDATTHRIVVAQDFDALLYARRLRRFRRTKNAYPPMAGRLTLQAVNSELWYAEKWIEDLNRRLDPGRSAPPTLEEIGRLPVAEQVPLLIGLLDEERIRYVIGSLDELPVTASTMLRDLGAAATEDLLDSLQDTRMSRVLSRFGGFGATRFTTVGEMCGSLVASSWGLSGFDKNGVLYDREQLEWVWQETRGMPNPERWLFALESDKLPDAVHRSASRALAKAPTVSMRGADPATSDHGLPIGPVVQWARLYRKEKGRVVAALLKRAETMISERTRTHERGQVPDYRGAQSYAVDAAVWDVDAALPMLRRVHIEYIADFKRKRPDRSTMSGFAALSSVLIYAGEDVWEEYESALGNFDPGRSPADLNAVLKPVWQHPDSADSIALAKRLFQGDGRWAPKLSLSGMRGWSTVLFYHPIFIDSAIEGLGDKTVVETAARVELNMFKYDVPQGSKTRTVKPEDFETEVGDTVDVRRCDLIAAHLAHILELGEFDPLKQEAKKDKVISAILERTKGGIDWAGVTRHLRPTVASNEQLFCTAPIWPDYSKKD